MADDGLGWMMLAGVVTEALQMGDELCILNYFIVQSFGWDISEDSDDTEKSRLPP